MNDAVQIEGALAIVGMTPPRSKAAFNRAHLVVRGADARIVQARTYTSDGQAVGPRLDESELQGLLHTGHAIEIGEAIPLVSGAALWVLRSGLPRRDRCLHDLSVGKLLVHPPIPGPDGSWLCVVDESVDRATELRDRWRTEAMREAKAHAANGDWARAETEAEIAQQVARGLESEVLALLSVAHEHTGRLQRAEGLLAMARNSRGSEFGAEVAAAVLRLRAELSIEHPAPHRERLELWALLAEHFPGPAKHLGIPMTARLDAAEPCPS
jgi:hypothetical protein